MICTEPSIGSLTKKSVVNFLRNLSYPDGILRGPIGFRRNSAVFRRMKYASIFFFPSSLRAPKEGKKFHFVPMRLSAQIVGIKGFFRTSFPWMVTGRFYTKPFV